LDKDCVNNILTTTITGFFALLGLLATMHVFYLKKLHEDIEEIDKLYRKLYKEGKIPKKDNPNKLKIFDMCNVLTRNRYSKLPFRKGYRTLLDKVKFVKTAREENLIKFNTLIAAFLTVIIWGISLLIMPKGAPIFATLFVGYLAAVLVSFFMFLWYLIKISTSSHT
jgi:hypothetical protein